MEDDKIWIVREIKSSIYCTFQSYITLGRKADQCIVSVCVDKKTAKLHVLERVNDIAERLEAKNADFEIKRGIGGLYYMITEKDTIGEVSWDTYVAMTPVSLNEYIGL